MTVATPAHADSFVRHLVEAGVDVGAARDAGRFIALDAATTLGSLLVDHRPDPQLFNAVIGGLIRDAAKGGRRVRVFGEMVALLWEAGQVTAAMELESLWNGLGLRTPFSLFCAYPASSISGDVPALEASVRPPFSGDRWPSRLGALSRCPPRGGDAPVQRRAARPAPTPGVSRSRRCRGADGATSPTTPRSVVTELAANAVRHARSPFTVTLSSRGHGVKIAVRDESPLAPNLRDPTSFDSRGRGLHLVAALSASWGADLEADGKVVWAELVP